MAIWLLKDQLATELCMFSEDYYTITSTVHAAAVSMETDVVKGLGFALSHE